MLELTKEERTTLSRLQRSDSFIYRQAESFSLIIGGSYVSALKTDVCKSLIEKHCLIEIGINEIHKHNPNIPEPDETEWVYAADPIVFEPNWQLEEK